MSAAMRFKKRYTGGSRFHGFKKKPKADKMKIMRESGRNETDPGTRKRGFRFK